MSTSKSVKHVGIPVANGVIHCRPCGFAHLDPYPAENTIKAYYDDDIFYRHHSPPGWLLKESAEDKRGAWRPYYEHLASLLEPGKPVLDVGCGAGWFVRYLEDRGYSAFGVEPSKLARQLSPIAARIYSDIDRAMYFRGNIVLALTLEHLVNPLAFLQKKILPKLEGRLIVTVPNEFNPLQIRAGGHWFVSPVHVNYFNGTTLTGLLERAGLRVVSEGATFPMELFIAAGLDYRGNDSLGRKCHRARLMLERLLGQRAYSFYGAMYKRWRIGRELIMAAER